MIATAKQEATQIGVEIIKKGGTAIDAAVAVGFALGVCEPNASGLGGGGFINIRNQEGVMTFIDFRETAPKSSKPSMWQLDENGDVINDAKSEGGKSVCIPGEAPGLIYLLDKYGTMSLKEVIQPSIELARKGFSVSNILYNDLVSCHRKIMRFKEEDNPFLLEHQRGDTFTNEPLAKVLELISEKGLKGYQEIGRSICDSVNCHQGDMSYEDILDYKVNELQPIKGTYRGYEILSSPPPSSGGAHIIQILNILENFDLKDMKMNSVSYIHLLSEVFKMAFADRQEYMGDPNFCKVPLDGLISKSYGHKLSNQVMGHAESYEFGNPYDHESKETTHYSIGDNKGNVVSVTKTISAFFGSGIVPENMGFPLNCQMRGFALGENKANSVAPGKKPLSSMSPTIILKEGHPFAVIGSPGGNRIIPIVAQVIIKLIDYDMDIKEAIDSPRVSNDMSEILYLEGRIGQDVEEQLKMKGHHVKRLLDYDRKLGGVQGVQYLNDKILGAADPRRDGVAKGC